MTGFLPTLPDRRTGHSSYLQNRSMRGLSGENERLRGWMPSGQPSCIYYRLRVTLALLPLVIIICPQGPEPPGHSIHCQTSPLHQWHYVNPISKKLASRLEALVHPIKVGGKLYEDTEACHVSEVFTGVPEIPIKFKDTLLYQLIPNTKKVTQFLAGCFWLWSQHLSYLRMLPEPIY